MGSRQEALGAIEEIRLSGGGYWPARLAAELGYLSELSRARSGDYDDALAEAALRAAAGLRREGAVTREAALAAEASLEALAPAAKSLCLVCAGHAHIDMNWLWGFEETVWVALETFRTVLGLMDEYPSFRFSQSQAAIYRIVERFEPEMLGRIRERVREGRWEVTASSWVESDRNLPSGESVVRQLVAARRYLAPLLGLEPGSLDLDFEPDAFGHAAGLPEILAAGGVKYLYHCRGGEGEIAYRWRAPSGASVIAYREPSWYLGPVEADAALAVPAFCARYGTRTALKVYGVGDHGGGPTRRDVERILDMAGWPLYPAVRFGTFRQFFRALEARAEDLPVVEGELNFVFEGCYSSQSRIKAANRAVEGRLAEAEQLSALALAHAGLPYRRKLLGEAWEDLLFCQFHDILPGSGVSETREYALGRLQECMASANVCLGASLRALAGRMQAPTQAGSGGAEGPGSGDAFSVSEGAGVGFGSADFGLPQVERGRGPGRLFRLFNPSPRDRAEIVELTAWDWPVEDERIEVRGPDGRVLAHQILPNDPVPFWGAEYWFHIYRRLLVEAAVPAGGYTTIALGEAPRERARLPRDSNPRLSRLPELVLENEEARVELDPEGLAIVEYLDKRTGQSLIAPGSGGARFRLLVEEDSGGMTAWNSGRIAEVQELNGGASARLVEVSAGPGALLRRIRYELRFRGSSLRVELALAKGSPRLEIAADCSWREIGRPGSGVPRLEFRCPLSYPCSAYRYDIPGGVIDRPEADQDRPALGWATGLREGGGLGLAIMARGKSGFRGYRGELALALLRGSSDPDPCPEAGDRRMRFAILGADSASRGQLAAAAFDYAHPVMCLSARPLGPSAGLPPDPPERSLFRALGGSVAVEALKPAEACDGSLVLRLRETEGGRTTARFAFAAPLVEAFRCGLDEEPLGPGAGGPEPGFSGAELSVEAGPWALVSVRFRLEPPAPAGNGS